MDEEDAVEVAVEHAPLRLVLVAAAEVPELDEVRARGRDAARVRDVHDAHARVHADRARDGRVRDARVVPDRAREDAHQRGLSAPAVADDGDADVAHALGGERRRHGRPTRPGWRAPRGVREGSSGLRSAVAPGK